MCLVKEIMLYVIDSIMCIQVIVLIDIINIFSSVLGGNFLTYSSYMYFVDCVVHWKTEKDLNQNTFTYLFIILIVCVAIRLAFLCIF